MINKVIKHQVKLQKKKDQKKKPTEKTYPTSQTRGHRGFAPKQASLKGASRQRSIGTRDSKSGS